MARCLDWRRTHELAVYDWKISHRLVPGEGGCRIHVWDGGVLGHPARVGLLLEPDPAVRSRVYVGLCKPLWISDCRGDQVRGRLRESDGGPINEEQLLGIT